MTRTMLGFAATAAGSRRARITVPSTLARYHANTATAGGPASQLLHASVTVMFSECLAWRSLNPDVASVSPSEGLLDSIVFEVRSPLQGELRDRFACRVPDFETHGAGRLG